MVGHCPVVVLTVGEHDAIGADDGDTVAKVVADAADKVWKCSARRLHESCDRPALAPKIARDRFDVISLGPVEQIEASRAKQSKDDQEESYCHPPAHCEKGIHSLLRILVPQAAHSQNSPWTAGILFDLLPQPPNVNIHGAGVDIFILAPNPLK